jgi:hypothetical protein
MAIPAGLVVQQNAMHASSSLIAGESGITSTDVKTAGNHYKRYPENDGDPSGINTNRPTINSISPVSVAQGKLRPSRHVIKVSRHQILTRESKEYW